MTTKDYHRFGSDAERLRLIRLLHVAKRDLPMDDADYRAMLLACSGGRQNSAKTMSLTELERALAHMKRCGFTIRTKGKPGATGAPPSRALADDPESTKIRALWLLLHELGAVHNPSEAALAAYVKRVARVDALQWINGRQAERLIETLKKWALRFLPAAVNQLALQARERPLSDHQVEELNFLIGQAINRGTFDPMQRAWQALRDTLK